MNCGLSRVLKAKGSAEVNDCTIPSLTLVTPSSFISKVLVKFELLTIFRLSVFVFLSIVALAYILSLPANT